MVIYGHDHTDSLGQPRSDLPPYQQGLFNRPNLSNQPEALWRQTYPAWSIPKRQPGKPELTQRRFRGHLSGCLDRLVHAGKGHAPRECPCTIGMAASRLGMHSECTICASLTLPFLHQCKSASSPSLWSSHMWNMGSFLTTSRQKSKSWTKWDSLIPQNGGGMYPSVISETWDTLLVSYYEQQHMECY